MTKAITMPKDITLTNNRSVILSNNCLKVVKDNLYNHNKIVGKNYSLNDIKSVAFRSTGVTLKFSNTDYIFVEYDEFNL